MQVRKRNGDIVPYDSEKIYIAISGAFSDFNEEFDDIEVLDKIENHLFNHYDHSDPIDVEDIQDAVEDALLYMGYQEEAKAYIRYRHEHALRRQQKNDEEILSMISGDNDYWKNENSNKNSELVTVQRDYLAGIVSTDIARNYIFPKDVIEAHDKGWCHQHDMDYMAQRTLHNCELINLNDMLQNGTVINNVKVNKPHRLITAMTITTQIMAAVSSSSYGGQSISLAHLAPFVRSSYNQYYNKYIDLDFPKSQAIKMAEIDTKKEIEDAVQTFNYQASTLFCLNGQSPFCSLFIYLNETEEYKDELIALTKEFLKQRIQGMPNREGVNVTQAFPKILYILQEDNYKPGTKYWDLTKLAVECSTKRLTPDYISEKVMKEIKVNGHGKGDCFPCMGCRSFLSPDPTTDGYNNISHALDYDGSPKYYGRFNCGVSSLNLPDAAFAALSLAEKNNIDDKDQIISLFFSILNDRAEICHKGLRIRCERLSNTPAKVAPILWMDGALARLQPNDKLEPLVHNSYATVSLGFVGGAEAVRILINKSISARKGEQLMTKILDFLSDKCDQWKKEENIGYSLYATPAESLCYKFALKTKKNYPEYFNKCFKGKEYFENSYHIPSSEEISPFQKIEIEGRLQRHCTGGAISYVTAADISNNPSVMYPVIEYIYNNIMYCELNIITSYCKTCGQSQTIEIKKDKNGLGYWQCSNCGETNTENMNVAARTCGYVGTNFFNEGKTQEIASRYTMLDDHDL